MNQVPHVFLWILRHSLSFAQDIVFCMCRMGHLYGKLMLSLSLTNAIQLAALLSLSSVPIESLPELYFVPVWNEPNESELNQICGVLAIFGLLELQLVFRKRFIQKHLDMCMFGFDYGEYSDFSRLFTGAYSYVFKKSDVFDSCACVLCDHKPNPKL